MVTDRQQQDLRTTREMTDYGRRNYSDAVDIRPERLPPPPPAQTPAPPAQQDRSKGQ